MVGALLTTGAAVLAGSLNPIAGPTAPGSQMYTLEQIHTRLTGGGNATKMATFTEPSSGPRAGTMHTLNEIYELAWPARVPKTAQTFSYAAGDDGDLERGVTWPTPRFTDNGDGTVTDNLTGLIWLKNANCFGQQTWANALTAANTLNSPECGLSDSSAEGDWLLPNLREQQSLLYYGWYRPALLSGHPFTGVQCNYYWTSTTYAANSSYAWAVNLDGGYDLHDFKTYIAHVWPVRGGE